MATAAKATAVNIVSTTVVATSVAIVVNLFTDKPGYIVGGAAVVAVVICQAAVMYVGEIQRQREAGVEQGLMLSALKATLPFSPSRRDRVEALRILRASLDAKRAIRLRPLVPDDRLDAVITWMGQTADAVVEVPAGQLRVLVALMGSGKTEIAIRWMEEGLHNAVRDTSVEIPIWLDSRDAAAGLQKAVHTNLGGDPYRPCRIVIDDLDSVGLNEAQRILDEARHVVRVWPNVAILATTRPGVDVGEKEIWRLDPWPPRRGVDLARLVLDRDVPHDVWTKETSALFTTPLLALAMARRISVGGASPTSRLDLLSGIVSDVLRGERPDQANVEVWTRLARLAIRILDSGRPVKSSAVGNEAEVWALTETKLVFEENRTLQFVLPVFEQHFGAQALRADLISIEDVAGTGSFPRWRYAIAMAFALMEPAKAELMFLRLSSVNAAAACWVLEELNSRPDGPGPSTTVEADGVRVDGRLVLATDAGSRSITAGLWLREAVEALLLGLGPIGAEILHRRDGKLVSWGFSLRDDRALLAIALDAVPPPAVVEVNKSFREIGLADGWRAWHGFRFPDHEFGRWSWAREKVRDALGAALKKRRLPASVGTAIDRERLWNMATIVARIGPGGRIDPRDIEALRARVGSLSAQARESTWTTWSGSGYSIDSDDVGWLEARLTRVQEEDLRPSWPGGDIPPGPAIQSYWQRYSPESLRQASESIVSEAISSYQDLVEINFPHLGDTLGLNSIRPIRFDGILFIPADSGPVGPWLAYTLSTAAGFTHSAEPTVNLSLGDVDSSKDAFDLVRPVVHNSVFYRWSQRGTSWVVGAPYAVTDLAYQWLIDDLKQVGLVERNFRSG